MKAAMIKVCLLIAVLSVTQARAQTFLPSQLIREEGKVTDSRYCYAFAMAALVSPVLGFEVDPRDIAVQAMKSWPQISANQMFDAKIKWGGDVQRIFPSVQKIGFCEHARFQDYVNQIGGEGPDWYTALGLRVSSITPDDLFGEVEASCGPRQRLPTGMRFVYEQNEESVKDPQNFQTATALRFLERIDSELNEGRRVILSYRVHYVTVIGRTEDGNYVIYDSIPHSYRVKNAFRNEYHGTQGEHRQLWSREALMRALHWSNQVGVTIPGIGYLLN